MFPFAAIGVAAIGGMSGISGCTRPRSTMILTDFSDAGQPRKYRETFDEAYFDIDAGGNLNLVLRRRPSSRGGEPGLTQMLHVRTVWRSIPGKTVAEPTQINSLLTYSIQSGGLGSTFEGAGAVLFDVRRRRGELNGTIDHAVLKPTRQLAAGEPLFPRAEISGRFTAKRDPFQVVRLMNELERTFGPRSAIADASAESR
ncbi:MAG: hypothetical protein AABZ12_07910 [Planctomycetota bacterium]